MRRMAITLSKGGVGKSTSATNLAHGLSQAGARVLLVDTDTQGQVAEIFGCEPSVGLAELLAEEVRPEEAIVEARPDLWILGGGRQLAGAKRLIARKEFGGERMLVRALAPYDGYFDYVILDTAPGWDALTINVLFYASEVLSPVSLEVLSVKGLIQFEHRLEDIRELHPELSLCYVVPTFFDRRVKKSEEILVQLQDYYGERTCAPIRYNVRLSEAPGYGQTILEYAPRSSGAEDYQNLVRRIQEDEPA